MRKILFALIVFSTFGQCFAQNDSLRLNKVEVGIETTIQNINSIKSEINNIQSTNGRISRNILDLKKSDQSLAAKMDSLRDLLSQNKQAIGQLNSLIDNQKAELSGQIKETEESASKRIASLGESLSKNTLYWIIAVLAVGLIALVLFLILRKRVAENQSSIVENLSSTRKQLEQEGIRLDEKLIGVMETQLKIIQEEKALAGNSSEPDHSLALKVADEIVRIEKNLERVEDEKRIKPLLKAIERIRDNFQANGYEIVPLLHKDYDDRMSIEVINFKTDNNLIEGRRVISSVYKPEIKFNGILIQRGQVDVSQSS